MCEQLCRFMDGEMAPEEAHAFGDHLVDCVACQEAMEVYLQLDGMARRVLEVG